MFIILYIIKSIHKHRKLPESILLFIPGKVNGFVNLFSNMIFMTNSLVIIMLLLL